MGSKKPCGVVKKRVFIYFENYFHYDSILILGVKCICFTNLSLN